MASSQDSAHYTATTWPVAMPLAQAFDERKALLLYGKDALLDGGTIGVLSLFDHRDCIVCIADLGLARCIVWNLLAAELIGAGTLAVSLEVCSRGDVGPLDVGALVQLSQRLRHIGYQRLEGVWEVRAVCALFGQCTIHIETAGAADNDKVDIGTRKYICKVLEGDLVLRQGFGGPLAEGADDHVEALEVIGRQIEEILLQGVLCLRLTLAADKRGRIVSALDGCPVFPLCRLLLQLRSVPPLCLLCTFELIDSLPSKAYKQK